MKEMNKTIKYTIKKNDTREYIQKYNNEEYTN